MSDKYLSTPGGKLPVRAAVQLTAVLLALIAVSCSQNKDIDTMSWGKCTSYGDFLWKKHVPDTLTREIVLEFNSDAERYMTSPVVFGIFRKTEDGSLVPVDNNDLEVYVDGDRSEDNTISVMPPDESVKVGLVLGDGLDAGSFHWYLKTVSDGGLDRINGLTAEEFGSSDSALMEIVLKKRKTMNPLAGSLLGVLSAIVLLLVLWLLIGRPIFYPGFRVKSISLSGPEPYFATHRLKGARKLVLTAKPERQGFMSRLFSGRIVYGVNPLWTTKIEIIPRDGRSIRIKTLGQEFFIMSKVLKVREEYELENTQTRGKTRITVS